MRLIFFLPFLFTTISCGQLTDESSNETKEVSTQVSVDTLNTQQHVVVDAGQVKQKSEELTTNPPDLYIDRVYYFESTQEPYVSLRFREGYNYDSVPRIKGLLDSIIMDDGEIRRIHVPPAIAERYFDLSLLDSIAIFTYSHVQVATGYLERVEYFEDLLESQFIAVFKSSNRIEQYKLYGINGAEDFYPGFETEILSGDSLTDNIKKEFNIHPKYEWGSSHVRIGPSNSVLSSYSYHSHNNEEVSYLIESSKAKMTTLMKVTGEFSIWELIPTSMMINNKPLLLLWLALPETDIMWYSPAVYTGTKYQMTKDPKILLSNYSKEETTLPDTSKCSSQILSVTHRKMTELTRADIHLFLRSFSESCRNNAEFSEWSNELLHQILNRYTKDLVLQLSEQDYNLNFILEELETPINDKYMPQELILKVNELGISNKTTGAVIAALKVAQSKY